MRIAYDYQAFCQQSYGGISRYVARLVKQIALGDHDVRVFAPLHRNRYLRDLPKGVIWGYGLERYPPRSARLFLRLNRYVGAIAMRKWQPNIVHETYYSNDRSAPAASRTVLTVYDMIEELFSASFVKNSKSSELKREAVRRADHIICISESTRNDLITLFSTPTKKVSCVHLGFERFVTPARVDQRRRKWPPPFLLYVGARSGYKNFDAFVQSVAASRRLAKDFGIIAFGGGKFSTAQWGAIRKLGFEENQVVQVFGDDVLLGQLYEEARAFVFPSLYEGFGLPPLEAMAHQCAVISSKTSSMPEVIGPAAEYFDPYDIEGMTNAIERVVYSDERIRELRALGQRQLQRFSWEKCAAETLLVYKRLV